MAYANGICELLDIDKLFSMITRKQYKVQPMHTNEVLNIRDYQNIQLNYNVTNIYDGFVYKIDRGDNQKKQIMLVLQDGVYNILYIDLKPFLVIINKTMNKIHTGHICNQMARVDKHTLLFFQDGPRDSYTKIIHEMNILSRNMEIASQNIYDSRQPKQTKQLCRLF